MSRLEITELSKSFGKKKVLDNVSFTCTTGEIVGIFGRNGSGKSTLLKLLFGTLKADSGVISVNSEIIKPGEIITSKKIAYLPQDTFLPKGRKVREIIPLFYTSGEEQDKIFYAPGVAKFENLKVGNLSLGQLRYFEILLLGNLGHPFLMLDEPFSMIEPLYKDTIKNLLVALKETKGILITDHYYNDVLEVTDSNFLIKEGRKIKIEGKTDLVKEEYLNSEG